MKKLLTFAAISCTTIALTACGDDVTNVTENNVGVQSFESFKKLPDCTKDNQGEMAIAKKEGLVYYCDDAKWKTLNGEDGIDGKDGEKGDKGETGAKGDAGAAGAKGDQGKKGDAGADGKDGSNGKDGSDGTNGVDGKDGEPGTSCTMAKLEDNAGYKVLCGGDSVGVVLNGKNGDKGDVGDSGENCEITDKGNGILEIKCGERTEQIYKAFCGSQSYDPESKFCFENALYSCGNKPYNPQEEFCDTRNDRIYNYITIGKQTWMAENLNYDTLTNYCYKDKDHPDEIANCEKYGRLYTWAAAMGKSEEECGYGYECVGIDSPHQGVCPGGWHLPTNEEWEALMEFISKDQEKSIETVGYYLKTNSGWNDYGNGNDYYGFSALPAGGYNGSGFYNVGYYAYFWSAAESLSNSAYHVFMRCNYDDLYSNYSNLKFLAYSVRCLKGSN